jgi:hypothetical protein
VIRLLAASFVLVALTACLSGRQTEEASQQATRAASGPSSGGCVKPGSATDVDQEPHYSANYPQRWTTAEGCSVRLDVLMTRQGQDACGGTKAADVLMGWPLGSSHQKPHPYRIFVHDPDNVFGDLRISRAFEEDAKLPEDAIDTGYRQEGTELWMRPHDDAFIYLVSDERVERWPRDASPPVCL